MATRVRIGKTWWGQAWLQALENCDHANRLPRGKSYYLHGKVSLQDFDSETNYLVAHVWGSAYVPYEVVLKLTPLTQDECEKLVDRISSDSLLMAKLLDGELPVEVADICDELGINLFPRSAHDLHMRCSCPDSARLCKHIAALIYCLADIIDTNPFAIFVFKGLDLVRALKDRGISIEDSVKDAPLTLSELLAPLANYPLKKSTHQISLSTLPLGTIKPVGESLLSLLPKTIRHSDEKNLQKWFQKSLSTRVTRIFRLNASRWARQEELETLDRATPSPFWETIKKTKEDAALKLTLRKESFDFLLTKNAQNQDRVLQSLWYVTQREEKYLPPSTQALRVVYDFAARLYQSRAFVPCVMQNPEGMNFLPQVWMIPSLHLPQTQTVFERFVVAVEGEIDNIFALDWEENLSILQKAYLLLTGALTTLHGMLAMDEYEYDIFKHLISHTLDKKTKSYPEVGRSLARYFRVLNLGRAYPWQPLIKLSSLKDGEVSVGFGIMARTKGAKPVMLKTLLSSSKYDNDRLAVLNILRTLSELYQPFEQLAKDAKNLRIDRAELADFLLEITPYLTLLGVTVAIPTSLKRLLSPKLSAQATSEEGFGEKMLGLDRLADFDWRVTLGEKELTEEEFYELLAHAGEIIYNGADYVYIDPIEIQKIKAKLENPPKLSPVQKLQAVLSGEFEGVEIKGSEALVEKLKALNEVPLLPPPPSLRATLRPYQARGYSWLIKNVKLGMGALIADDMGLGKTLQVIAAMTQLKEDGELAKEKVLAVVPTTLLVNWQREIEKFSPTLKVAIYHGPKRKLPKSDFDVLLTSYGTARMDIEVLKTQRFRLLVIDEAQAIKNSTSSQSQALKELKARQVIAMSGTPVENRLMEYWSIFSLVQPRLLGSQKDFKDHFARPIEAERDSAVIDAFRKLTAPFMLRRLKTDKSIISDLPDKIQQDQFVTLRKDQAVLYEKYLQDILRKIEEAKIKAKETGEDIRILQRGLVLKLITGLKQICNSVSQFQKTDVEYPDSGKGDLLIDLVERSFDADRKVLIFTQYREMGDRLQKWLKSTINEDALFLHGGVTVKKRAEMVDRFQNDPTQRVMILSLKAGGTGLNLTQASTVIHYDLWWNPAVEAQATDRAYRIGQKKDVLVYRFITKGTFEERINEMLENKKELADLTVTTGESWVGDLSETELKALFELDKE